MYIFDRPILSLPILDFFKLSVLIVRPINVLVLASTNEGEGEEFIEMVEFFIDGESRNVDNDPPYEMKWNERKDGIHKLKVVAHDVGGSSVEYEINVFKLL